METRDLFLRGLQNELNQESHIFKILIYLIRWRRRSSPKSHWLRKRLLTLHRIITERRIPINQYLHGILPTYHAIQFNEQFRMAPTTFEV